MGCWRSGRALSRTWDMGRRQSGSLGMEETRRRGHRIRVFPVVVQIPDIPLDFVELGRSAATADRSVSILLSFVCTDLRNQLRWSKLESLGTGLTSYPDAVID